MQLESWKMSPITDVLFHSNMQGDFFHLYNDIHTNAAIYLEEKFLKNNF